MTWFDDAQKQIDSLTPAKGFNVVAVDAQEQPGQALYFVEHCDELAAAEACRRKHAADSGDVTYVYGPKGTPGEERTDDFSEEDHPRDEGGKFAQKGTAEVAAIVAKRKATKLANEAKLKEALGGTTAFNKVQGEKKAAANEKRKAAWAAKAAVKVNEKEQAAQRNQYNAGAKGKFQQEGIDYANQVAANRGKPMSMEEQEYQNRAYAAREANEQNQKLTHEGVGADEDRPKENAWGYDPSVEREKQEAAEKASFEKKQGKLGLPDVDEDQRRMNERMERAVKNNAKQGEHARPEADVRAEVQKHFAEEKAAKVQAAEAQRAANEKAAADRIEREAKVKEADDKVKAAGAAKAEAEGRAQAARDKEEAARQEWERVGGESNANTAQAKGALRGLQGARKEATEAVKAEVAAQKAHDQAQQERNAFGVKLINRDSNDRDQLEGRKIVDIKPLGGGVSESFKVTLDDGTKGVWKSGDPNTESAPDRVYGGKLRDNIDAGTYYQRNAAVSAVAPLLGVADLVPATVVHDPSGSPASGIGSEHDPDHAGSLQAWAEGTSMPGYGTRFDKDAAERMRAADFVLGSTDRHSKNVMVAEHDGKQYPVMIDNDLCLPKATGDRFIQPMDYIPRGTISQGTRALVQGYDHVAIARTLHANHIEPEAVKLAVIRAQRLQNNPGLLNNVNYDQSNWHRAANAYPTKEENAYADEVYKKATGG